MADECCDTIIGGQVYIVMKDRRYEAMGDVTVQPMDVTRGAGATSGGRMWVTETAELRKATVTFANHCDADPLELFEARCKADITVVEKSRGIRHLFTRAAIVGTVEGNLSNGEIGGIEIVTDNYSRISTDTGLPG